MATKTDQRSKRMTAEIYVPPPQRSMHKKLNAISSDSMEPSNFVQPDLFNKIETYARNDIFKSKANSSSSLNSWNESSSRFTDKNESLIQTANSKKSDRYSSHNRSSLNLDISSPILKENDSCFNLTSLDETISTIETSPLSILDKKELPNDPVMLTFKNTSLHSLKCENIPKDKCPLSKIYVPPHLRPMFRVTNNKSFPTKFPEKQVSVSKQIQNSLFGDDFGLFVIPDQTKTTVFKLPVTSLHNTICNSPTHNSTTDVANNNNTAPNLNYERLRHILELYDFPEKVESTHLQAELRGFEDSGFVLKWIDETHCLAVFSSPTEAAQALRQISGILIKARTLEEASLASQLKVFHSPGDWAMPYKKRPISDSSVASRIISSHLGLPRTGPKSTTSPEILQARKEARERERERRRNRKAIWEDD